MLDKVTVALFAVLIYLMYFRTETRLTIFLEISGDPKQLKTLGNIEDILKVEQDIGDHMKTDRPLSSWNYVLVTGKQADEEESERYIDYLKDLPFIKDFKIQAFEAKPITRTLVNAYIFAKGLYIHYISGQSLSKGDGMEGVLSGICTKDALNNSQKDIIVNLIRYRPGNSDMSEYEGPIIHLLFPLVGARVPMAGKPISDHWDKFALVEYTRQGFCRMASSREFQEKLKFKQTGLEDSITLLTQRANF